MTRTSIVAEPWAPWLHRSILALGWATAAAMVVLGVVQPSPELLSVGVVFVVALIWSSMTQVSRAEVAADGITVTRSVGTFHVGWDEIQSMTIYRGHQVWGDRMRFRIHGFELFDVPQDRPDLTPERWREQLSHISAWATNAGVSIHRR